MDGLSVPIDSGALASSGAERLLSEAQGAARARDAVQAAADFERLFATLLVKEMRRGLGEGFFGSGPGADVYEGWLDEHLGQTLAEGRGLGLRIALERELGGTTPPPQAAPPTGEVQP